MNSISKVAEKIMPIPFINWITKGDLDVGNNLKDYNGNTLILHSETDEIVGYENALLNHEICGKDKSKIEIIKGTHNNLKLDWKIVKEFMYFPVGSCKAT